MADTIAPPLVLFITGDDVEDFENPAYGPRAAAAADALSEAVRRIDPSISSLTDSEVTTVLFGPSLRYVDIMAGEDRLHITAYDGTDAAPHTETITSDWRSLTGIIGIATRLVRFLKGA